jgi:8-oxo-dGTP diphosphatase
MTIKPLPPSRINVVGALIQSGKAVLIAQRATGELAGKWEFPGGKVESGETHQEALVREITEELGITIIVGGHVGSIDFEVATKRLSLHCYWGTVVAGAPSAEEHSKIEWVEIDRLLTYDLAPADIPIAKRAIEQYARD